MPVAPWLSSVNLATSKKKQPANSAANKRFQVYLTAPVLTTKVKVEYLVAVFDISYTTVGNDRKTSVTVTGSHLTLTSKVAAPLIRAVAKAKGLIDAGILDRLVSDALLDAIIKPAQEVVVPGSGRSGRTWMDVLGMVGQEFGNEFTDLSGQTADGGSAEKPWPGTYQDQVKDLSETAKGIGGVLAAAGGLAVLSEGGFAAAVAAGALLGPAAVIVGAGLAIFGGGLWIAGKVTSKGEYPQYPEMTPANVEKTLALMASLMGSRFITGYLHRILDVAGGGIDAPERKSANISFFGWMRLDAWIIAMLRESLEMKSGAGVTTPTGETPSTRGGFDQYGPWVRDPLWDPYLVQTVLNSAHDRAAVVNSMASRIRAIKP